MRPTALCVLTTVVIGAQAWGGRQSVRLSVPNGGDHIADSGIDYTLQGGKLVPSTVTVGEGRALKDVIAPELWEEFGLDANGDPVDESSGRRVE